MFAIMSSLDPAHASAAQTTDNPPAVLNNEAKLIGLISL